MENVYVYAFATFGHPSDFQQACMLPVKNKLPNGIKLFDLTHAIKVFPKSKLYSIRIENINGEIYISYSIYTFTKELLSDRDGTFIGSSILFINATPDESLAIESLSNFHNILIDKNVKDGRLLINHLKDFTLSKSIYEDFNKIDFNLKKIESEINSQKNNSSLVVWSNENNLDGNYKKAIQLFEKYDTIYFTESKEIADFARSRGLYKTIDEKGFEDEINNLIEERKQKREQSISEFEREVQSINDDKNRTTQEFKNQIDQSERTHLENERKLRDSKEDINKIAQFYDDFLHKTKNLINQLRQNNGKLEEVKQIHNSNKILFNNCVSVLKRPNYVTNIPKAKPKGNLVIENQNQRFESKSNGIQNVNDEKKKKNKIDVFKVATLILSFLLIFTLVYFLFIKSDKVVQPIPNQEQQSSAPNEVLPIKTAIIELEELNPKSNAELNENDYQIIAKQLNYSTKIEDVVKTIYNKNPTDIKNNYTGQEENYGKHLIELNKNCFEENNGVYYFSRDTLLHIPSYKK